MNAESTLAFQEDEIRHCARTFEVIAQKIRQSGPMRLDQYMQIALHHPEVGYYTQPRHMFGAPDLALRGDFTTAPELSPWFGRTLARQIKQVLDAVPERCILEFGAGSGKLARDILQTLNDPSIRYRILDLSGELQARQAQLLQLWADQIDWLTALPEQFQGIMLANEVLDAMPVRLLGHDAEGQPAEKMITLQDGKLDWHLQQLNANHLPAEFAAFPKLPGYFSETHEQASAWIRALGQCLSQGAILLLDYGFPAAEYYHPQRSQGTLMCHIHHRSHDQVLAWPGIQDVTAHVNFTAVADAALDAGLDVLGYTSQANFLLNCGITELLSALDPADAQHYAEQIAPVQKLLSEAEMGELFKVMMLGKGLDASPIGFARADRRARL